MRFWTGLALVALLATGCSRPGQGLAYVLNRTGPAAGQSKSFSFPTAELRLAGGNLTLQAGSDVALTVASAADPASQLGKVQPLASGTLRLEGRDVPIRTGHLSLQTLQEGTFRGNFNAALGDGLEAVGYFEARLTQP